MLPPVDADVTSSNPKFDALYRDLCANKLHSDGSSKLDAKAAKDRQGHDEVSTAPQCTRLRENRFHIDGPESDAVDSSPYASSISFPAPAL